MPADDPISDFDGLPLPPLDDFAFPDDITDNILPFDSNDEDGFNFDFTFDDINLPSDTEEFLNSTLPDDSFPMIRTSRSSDPYDSGSNTESPDVSQVSDDPNFNGYFNFTDSGDKCSDVVVNCSSVEIGQVSGDESRLNVSSSDSRDSSQESENKKHLNASEGLNCVSTEVEGQNREFSGPTSSQGSDNCARSVASSTKLGKSSDRKIKLEETGKDHLLLKRKKANEDVNSESTRTIKYRRSTAAAVTTDESRAFTETNDDEEKRKARLIRNRESAQLSRQRKKHYVEELEDKVRAMHSTIHDLNAKISYIAAENATLRQQMKGSGAVGPPPMHGMYLHPSMAPMGYPWMPCPPYVIKPQGSQVPLVPIPRLKPQQQSVKPTKKDGSKKNVGKSKSKRVASVSFLGILFFMLLFGGLVPMVNVRYGRIRDVFSGGSSYIGYRVYDQHHDRILMVNGTDHEYGAKVSSKNFDAWKSYNNTSLCGHCGRGHVGGAESNMKQSSSEEFSRSGNASEPLAASLYVPRNDKLVKIDGNLIIHSVLASEKARAYPDNGKSKSDKETSLAVAFNIAPSISVQGAGQNNERHSHIYHSTTEQQRALTSGSRSKDKLKSTPVDGKLQQWFREGLAGPMLSSGMCTEVFQFDVSPTPGAIVPAPPGSRNISMEERKNSTHLNKGRNRRILHGLSIPTAESANNVSKENNRSNSQKESSHRNSSVSPMIVSVLVDPREIGDADGDGMIGTKSLPRIFVVVLIDSVKYVTYSCMLPFKGSSHLVTA